jgi:DNA transposition AAA+ family ATPase
MSEETVNGNGQTGGGGFSGPRRGDHINVPRTELLAGIAGYEQAAQDDLLWLHGYACDALRGSRSALVEWLGVDWTTIWRIWQGTYGANIASVLERVRHRRQQAVVSGRTGFVETVVTKRIWATCDIARAQNAIVMVTGRSGRCKTHSVREWQRGNNHGRSLYVECPVSGGFRALLESIAKSAGIGIGRNNNDLMAHIERSFDYRHTLIFDEVARLLPNKTSNIAALEFIRRLHDACGCGVVLVATDTFPREMRAGRLSEWFEQLYGRIEVTLAIPERVSRTEAAEICAAFCSGDPSPEMVKEALGIGNSAGRVRLLFTLLRHSAQLASRKGEALDAEHLRSARDFRDSLNRWED